MKRLWKWVWFIGVVLMLIGCAAGYRFKAGVDVSVTKVVQDSTRTVSMTKSGYVERDSTPE